MMLTDMGVNSVVAQTLPPLIIGTLVQIMNMPLVRATITIQDPKTELKNTWAALVWVYKTRGGIIFCYFGTKYIVLQTISLTFVNFTIIFIIRR